MSPRSALSISIRYRTSQHEIQYGKRNRDRPESETAVSLHQLPLQNLSFDSLAIKAGAEHACTGHNPIQAETL